MISTTFDVNLEIMFVKFEISPFVVITVTVNKLVLLFVVKTNLFI
ncbi:MAG: hypothetical protein R2680_13495 [Nitrososphaeraceae archaeon]